MRIAIYTCTFHNYDNLLSPVARTPSTDLICFSDAPIRSALRWRYRPMPEATRGLQQNEANRYCKMMHSKVLPDYDLSIYVDGNILILADLTPLIEEFLASGADLALFPGEMGRTVRDEIEETLRKNIVRSDRREAAQRQLRLLEEKGEADLPITMNGVLFRRHNRPGLDALMQAWWDDTYRFALRDQFNLPGLIRSTDVPIHRWDWQFHFTDNPYFRSYFHRKPRGSAISTLARDVAKGIFLRASHSAPDRFASRLMNGIGIRTPYVPTRGMRDYLVEGPSVTGLAHGEHEAEARN